MKNMTYRNLMIVIRKIERKGYGFEEAERMARRIFEEFKGSPQGLSVEQRVERILNKDEWELENT